MRPQLRAMLAAIRSAAVLGVEAFAVTVEVDAAPGLPGWTVVGLPSDGSSTSKSRGRARTARGGR